MSAAAAAALAEALGATIDETASPFGDLIDADRAIVAMETDLTGLRKLAAGPRGSAYAVARARCSLAPGTAEEFTDAITAESAVNAMVRFMERYDLLLTPTAPLAAFRHRPRRAGRHRGRDGRRRCLVAHASIRRT